MKKEPLVSVIVISYNSASFVQETLESIFRQDYRNIQLIISDDCSTDHTAELCSGWLSRNSSRFAGTRLLTSPVNTGVAGNCNRGLAEATGEWLKFIAADDILFTDCISRYMEHAGQTSSRFLFSYPSVMVSAGAAATKNTMEAYYARMDPFYSLDAKEQFKYLLVNQIPVNPPTLFCCRRTLLHLNGFDERFRCEDLPLYLHATSAGYRFSLVREKLVGYRIHNAQLSIKDQKSTVNEFWLREQVRIKKQYFGLRSILGDPLLFLEYLLETASKLINARLGGKSGFQKILGLLRSVKSRISFAYIRTSG